MMATYRNAANTNVAMLLYCSHIQIFDIYKHNYELEDINSWSHRPL